MNFKGIIWKIGFYLTGLGEVTVQNPSKKQVTNFSTARSKERCLTN